MVALISALLSLIIHISSVLYPPIYNMCLRPLHLRTSALRLSFDGGQPFWLSVPCGHCAECDKLASDSYYLRAYYHARTCIEHGGFVYFDTLTYRDADLPRISDISPLPKELDFPRFNYMHTRLFFVRLRTYLRRKGYVDKRAFSYFLSSEYGSSPQHTHRPHYHVLFFVDAHLPVSVFSAAVSACWPYGRTDGLPYQTKQYISRHTFSLANGCDLNKLSNISLYVAKYVAKDCTFIKDVNQRLNYISDYLRSLHLPFTSPDGTVHIDHVNTSNLNEVLKVLRRHVYPFHRQSKGFGLSALAFNRLEDIMSTGMMSFPSSNSIVKHVPLPMYFKRKIFYDLTKDFRGEPKWELNALGEQYKLSRAHKSALLLSQRISDLLTSDNSPISSQIFSLLGSRSLYDFAAYLLFYKGRIASEEGQMSLLYWHDSNVTPLDEWLPLIYKRKTFTKYLLNSINPLTTSHYYEDCHLTTFADFLKVFVISQDSHPAFKDFDTIFDLYCQLLQPLNESKQSAYEYTQVLRRRHKALTAGVNPDLFNPLKTINYVPQTKKTVYLS